MLQILGLSRPTEGVYRAMLANPQYGVKDLASATGLTESDVKAALDELADLALLRPAATGSSGLRPVSPKVGLAALLATAEAEAAAKRAQLESTRAAIAAIAAEHELLSPHQVVHRLDGLDAVRTRLEELQQLTELECLSLNPGGAHRPDARQAASPLNRQALARGVVIRAVCRESFRNDPETLAYARGLIELGGYVRTFPTLPMPLVVLDRRIALLPLEPSDPRIGAVEVTSQGIVAAMCALFEQIWASGVPFGEAARADPNGCTPFDRALLNLVRQGHTDETAARKLGVSLRTVRRMMSQLMDRLDASSRFQAGVNAAQRGWL